MSIDGSVSGGSGKVFALSVRDVLAISLNVPFGESEVKNEDLVAGFVESDAEVIGLDISVDEVPVMNVLNPLNHLIDEDQHTFQGELSEGLVEQRFE